MNITEKGIYDITAAEYHANPCPEFSISRSFLADIIKQSPLHAMSNSKELNQDETEDKDSRTANIGKAMHEIALGFDSNVVVVEADSFRTKAAQEMRDAAKADGKIPLLTADMKKVMAAMDPIRGKLVGKCEQTYIWKRGISDIWCRAMLDCVTDDGWIIDYKTTGGSAEPGAWVRNHLYPDLLDMQAAWYIEGYERVTGNPCKGFKFVVQEQKPPYAVSTIQCDIETIMLGLARINMAFDIAEDCLKSGIWYGYDRSVAIATPPAWIIAEWEAKNAS